GLTSSLLTGPDRRPSLTTFLGGYCRVLVYREHLNREASALKERQSMSMRCTTRVKIAVLTLVLMLAMSLTACSDKPEVPVNQIVVESVDILQGLMECRNKFSAWLSTIHCSV